MKKAILFAAALFFNCFFKSNKIFFFAKCGCAEGYIDNSYIQILLMGDYPVSGI